MVEIFDVQQGSDEWGELRRGIITASKIGSCLTSKLNISTAGIKTAAKSIVAEIHEVDEPHFQSWAMERGNSLEAEARKMLSFAIGSKIRQAGFYLNKKQSVGCSPDGVIDMKIGVEIKCPLAKTHIGYLVDNEIPNEYIPQVQFSMYVTGFESWFFCSYYPKMKPLIISVEKNEDIQNKIKEIVLAIKDEISRIEKIILK